MLRKYLMISWFLLSAFLGGAAAQTLGGSIYSASAGIVNGILFWVQSVTQFGATTSGDQTTKFQATNDSLSGISGGLAVIPAGTFTLGSTVNTSSNVAWWMLPGAVLSGAGGIDANTNSSLTNGNALTALMATFGQTGVGTYTPLFISSVAQSIAGTNHTEVSALVTRVVQHTASSGSNNEHDASGLTPQCYNAVSGGWCFAMDPQVIFPSGSDGYTPGIEIAITNNSGIDSGVYGTSNAKLGLHSVAAGSNKSSAGLAIDNLGTGSWLDGVYLKATALVNFAFRLNNGSDLMTIDPAGNVMAQSYKAGASAGVSCSGSPTVSFASVNGIVTHC